MSNSKVQTCNLRDNLGIWSFGKIRSTIFSFFIRDISSTNYIIAIIVVFDIFICLFQFYQFFRGFSQRESARRSNVCRWQVSRCLTIFKYCRVECVGSSNVPEGRR